MLQNTKIKIVCNGKLVNTYSDIGHGVWKNPFEFVPCVGDYLELSQNDTKGVSTYRVEERLVRSKVGFTAMNVEREVILNVKKVGNLKIMHSDE